MKVTRLFVMAAITLFVFTACVTGSFSIRSPEIYPIRRPVAGNYSQGLYKYPLRTTVITDELPYTQTLTWSPEVEKTFAADTQYTAIMTLEPKHGHQGLFRSSVDYNITGLPEEGVELVEKEVADGNLVVRITFEKTASEIAEPEFWFNDEFEGDSLDFSKWERPSDVDRQGRSTWDRNMISVSDGALRIKVMRDLALGRSKINDAVAANNWIRTGAINTRRAEHPYSPYWGPVLWEGTFGYYEARIKFPQIDGTWGAFWLMTNTMESTPGSGRGGTEIDIVETIHNASLKYNAALHWDGYGANHKSTGSDTNRPVNIYDGEFHTFALCWSADEYVFYVDDQEFWRTDGGAAARNVGINQNPNFIIFSVEAADWAGILPVDFTEDEMVVDWVRVWSQPRN